MFIPYKSPCYDIDFLYERFGNVIIPRGSEYYMYLMPFCFPGIELWRYSISNKMHVYDYYKQEFVIISYNTLYPSVNLYNVTKGKYVTYSLHRVYMLAFCYFPGCENYDVNHIDGNKANCIPYNLEWLTHAENMDHSHRYLHSENHKLSDSDIIDIIDMYNNGCTFNEITEKYSISGAYASDIIHGKNGRNNTRTNNIKLFHPIIRERQEPKLNDNLLAIIADRYNNGEEYYELATEYGIDRSHLTKAIKRYASTHPEIKLRELKKFNPNMVEQICTIFDNNSNLSPSELYDICIESFNLENNPSIRKALSNIYNGKTHKNISSNHTFSKSSTTIERVAE